MQRPLIGVLLSPVMVLVLACGAGSRQEGGEPVSTASSEDLSWAAPNPDAPGPGDLAPALAIEETLNGPAQADADWAALKGKATVLEFWATWCAPCVDVIPHLNELEKDLSGEDVRFVSVTDEEAATVTPFLESIPISGLVALDLDRSVFQDYGVLSIPTTFLVDKEGVVQAVTRAHELTREDLVELMAGRRPDVPELEDIDALLELETLEKATGRVESDDFQVTGSEGELRMFFRPTTKTEYAMSRGQDEIRLVAADATLILSVAYDVPPGRMVMETEWPDQKYDVLVNSGGRPENLEPLMQQVVSTGLGIEASWEDRIVAAYVLVRNGEPKLKPLPDSAGRGSRVSSDSLGATDLDGMVDRIAYLLERPMINETGITGRYQILLKFDTPEPESVFRAIEETLGLAVVEEKRPVEMLVVRKHAAGE